jgi:hypothetical protein
MTPAEFSARLQLLQSQLIAFYVGLPLELQWSTGNFKAYADRKLGGVSADHYACASSSSYPSLTSLSHAPVSVHKGVLDVALLR